MGGHGALTIAFKNPTQFKSVSAFSPICNPTNGAWGKKALGGYLGIYIYMYKYVLIKNIRVNMYKYICICTYVYICIRIYIQSTGHGVKSPGRLFRYCDVYICKHDRASGY